MMKKLPSTKNLKTQTESKGLIDGLPSRPTKRAVDPAALKITWIGPPGFGKTSSAAALSEDTLLLAFEQGHGFVECHKIIIDSWDGDEDYVDEWGDLHLSAKEALRRITETDRFRHIAIDTIDSAVLRCVQHHERKKKVEHISDIGDYGKGYDVARNKPMTEYLDAIIASGRGISYITHRERKEIRKGKGDNVKITVVDQTTLPDKIFALVHKQSDAIFQGYFGKHREGRANPDRIIVTQGDEEILAKNRGDIWPPKFILPQTPKEVTALFRELMTDPEAKHRVYQEYLEIYEKPEKEQETKQTKRK